VEAACGDPFASRSALGLVPPRADRGVAGVGFQGEGGSAGERAGWPCL